MRSGYNRTARRLDGMSSVRPRGRSARFYSLYIPAHTHPDTRRTPAPSGTPELGREYYRTPDPYVMAVCGSGDSRFFSHRYRARRTTQPIALAKTIADGRWARRTIVLGIDRRWNHEEMENHGSRWRAVRDVGRETMLGNDELWSHRGCGFHGEFIDFTPSFQWPSQ